MGLIQIEATEDGEIITVTGAFAERMEYGSYVLTSLLKRFADKIAANAGAGYSAEKPFCETLHRPKPLPRGLVESNFMELNG